MALQFIEEYVETGKVEGTRNALKYAIATVVSSGVIYWQGRLDFDWKWTSNHSDAETYETLVEAQAKAVWIAFMYPSYLGLLEVVRFGHEALHRAQE